MDKALLYIRLVATLLFISEWLLILDLFIDINSGIINLVLITTSLILILMLYRAGLFFNKPKKKSRK